MSPFFEARFHPTDPVIPYLQASGVFRGTIESRDGYDRNTERFVGCRFGLGLHIFVSESVSLSPRLEMEYVTGLGDENPVTHRWRAERAFARFCGRSWMNRPEDARAIQQFGQRAQEAMTTDAQPTRTSPTKSFSPSRSKNLSTMRKANRR